MDALGRLDCRAAADRVTSGYSTDAKAYHGHTGLARLSRAERHVFGYLGPPADQDLDLHPRFHADLERDRGL